jgi:nucleotide-binding universal stress UspA family protein
MPHEQTFRKIIVGCSGEPPGRDALALGAVLSRLEHAELMAIAVYADPMLPFPRSSRLKEDCAQILRADRDAIAPEGRMRVVAALSPAAALQHAAEREHADLLVLGSDRRAAPGGVRAGRHARQLLYDAPCAIALAPRDYATQAQSPRRIVAGHDGSPESVDAVAYARRLAAAAGASLRVITVVDPTPPAIAGYDTLLGLRSEWDEMVAHARETADAQLSALIGDAAGIETAVLEGVAGAILCDVSRQADLLVVGSRRWGALERLVIGSTAEHVVRHAHCAVLVAPRSSERRSAPSRKPSAAAPAHH